MSPIKRLATVRTILQIEVTDAVIKEVTMERIMRGIVFAFSCLVSLITFSNSASAEGWCDIQPGYQLISNGNKAESFYMLAQLPGQANAIWLVISDGSVGKGNVALVLAAQMAGKGISIYLDAPSATCATFPSWAPMGSIRHLRIL